MQDLSEQQRGLLADLARSLSAVPGIRAVVLGGSYARGQAQPGSDLDLGLLYDPDEPIDLAALRQVAASLNDSPDPLVTDFYGWGPWVNGGAWLSIRGQRVDFLYRDLTKIEAVISDANQGRYELNEAQQPPFGFFSPVYLGEILIAQPLYDPDGLISALQARLADYPDALRRAVIGETLWAAEFGLTAFAPKFAARADTWGTSACLSRAVNHMLLALFALNRHYPLNDKTALAEAAAFDLTPPDLALRVQRIFARPGQDEAALKASLTQIHALWREVVALSAGLYQPRFPIEVLTQLS